MRDPQEINTDIQWHLLQIRALVSELILTNAKQIDDLKEGFEATIQANEEKDES